MSKQKKQLTILEYDNGFVDVLVRAIPEPGAYLKSEIEHMISSSKYDVEIRVVQITDTKPATEYFKANKTTESQNE